MGGKAGLEALAQVQKASSKGAALIALSEAQVLRLHALTGRQTPEAYSSTYHSNDIIETLEQLKDAFIARKNSQDTDEFETKSIFDEEVLGHTNEAKFAQMEKDQKEKISADKNARMQAATKEKDQE